MRTWFRWDDTKLQNRLALLHAKAPIAFHRQAYAECEMIMAKSKRLVPVDTGTLRASGRVVAEPSGGASCEYGGAAGSYAIYVHEDLEAHHPVGQAKFLEEPFLEHVRSPAFMRRMKEAVRDAPG